MNPVILLKLLVSFWLWSIGCAWGGDVPNYNIDR